MDAESLALVRLNLVPGLGPGRISRLLVLHGSASAALLASGKTWEEAGVPPEVAARALQEESLRAAEEEVELSSRLRARILTFHDGEYPEVLRRIPLPPPVLYSRGRSDLIGDGGPAIAVVGTRTPTGYGREMARGIAAGLAGAGCRIVSGLARGIDSAAHRGSLEGGGATIAVLGSGFESPYPGEDPALPERIEASGLLVTEFPLAAPPRKGNFPRRNRLISGLSSGVVVVEAAARSGSLLTAQWALDQNRTVMAVPGRADNPMARGSNGLLKRGAALIEGPEDVLQELGLGKGAGTRGGAEPREPLLDALGAGGATVEEIADATGRAPEDLYVELLRLEIAGTIRRAPGGIYRRSEPLGAGARR